MEIRCVHAFGNFEPGDVVEVPDGAVFDEVNFVRADAVTVPPAEGGA